MAVATNCNPGSSPCSSLLVALHLSCSRFRLTPEEALAGATRNAAAAIGRSETVGTIEVGKAADLACWSCLAPAELCYNLGLPMLITSFIDGDEIGQARGRTASETVQLRRPSFPAYPVEGIRPPTSPIKKSLV